MNWPETTLDTIGQLRVMAGVFPGLAVDEIHLDAPYEEVWAFIEDLGRAAPTIDPLLASVTVTERKGTHWKGRVRPRFSPVSLPLAIEMRPGLCWMEGPARQFTGMAAVADPEGGTRYGHLEGLGFRGAGLLRPVWRRTIAWDLKGIVRHFNS